MYLSKAIKRAEEEAMSAQEKADITKRGGDIKNAQHKKEIAIWLKHLLYARRVMKNLEDGRISEKAALEELKEALKEIRGNENDC